MGTDLNPAPILWITGIPASGKTTLGRHLVRHFRRQGIAADMVDGDEIRKLISAGLGFSKEDRLENNRRIAWIARMLARNGVIAMVASVSPYTEGRLEARKNAGMEGIPFVEIYAKCSSAVARSRDIKGTYVTKSDVTGLGAPYEVPARPEILVDTELLGPDEALEEVLKRLP